MVITNHVRLRRSSACCLVLTAYCLLHTVFCSDAWLLPTKQKLLAAILVVYIGVVLPLRSFLLTSPVLGTLVRIT